MSMVSGVMRAALVLSIGLLSGCGSTSTALVKIEAKQAVEGTYFLQTVQQNPDTKEAFYEVLTVDQDNFNKVREGHYYNVKVYGSASPVKVEADPSEYRSLTEVVAEAEEPKADPAPAAEEKPVEKSEVGDIKGAEVVGG